MWITVPAQMRMWLLREGGGRCLCVDFSNCTIVHVAAPGRPAPVDQSSDIHILRLQTLLPPSRLLQLLSEHRPQLQHLLLPSSPPSAHSGPLPPSALPSTAVLPLLVLDAADVALGLPLMRSTVSSLLRLLSPRQILLTTSSLTREVEGEARALALAAAQRRNKVEGDARALALALAAAQRHGTLLLTQHRITHSDTASDAAQGPGPLHGPESAPQGESAPLPPLPLLLLDAPHSALTALMATLPASLTDPASAPSTTASVSLNNPDSALVVPPPSNSWAGAAGVSELGSQTVQRGQRVGDPPMGPLLRLLVVPAGEAAGQLLGLVRHFAAQRQQQGQYFRVGGRGIAIVVVVVCVGAVGGDRDGE